MIFLTAILMLTVGANGCVKKTFQERKPQTNEYTNTSLGEFGFFLQYPQNWKITGEEEINNVKKGAADSMQFASDDDQETFSINVLPKDMEGFVKNSRVTEKEEMVDIDGANCVKTFGSTMKGKEDKIIEIMCQRSGHLYLITTASENEGFDLAEKTFRFAK